MSAMIETRKTIAKTIVIRSRFFSMAAVPEFTLYRELANMSEMPVPLPECMRTRTMRLMAEMAQTMKAMGIEGDNGIDDQLHDVLMTDNNE